MFKKKEPTTETAEPQIQPARKLPPPLPTRDVRYLIAAEMINELSREAAIREVVNTWPENQGTPQ